MTVPSPDGQRVVPALPVGAYRTYQIIAPRETHFRPGSCAEAECAAHLNGWRTVIDESTALGQRQAHYVRRESGRRYSEHRGDDGLTVFTFEAGQRCFTEAHQIPIGRPELYLVRDGDWRGNPTGRAPYQHTRPEHWVEDFQGNQDRLSRLIEKG